MAKGAGLARKASACATASAMKLFMSAEPRPYSRPSFTTAPSGSTVQAWPSQGTVSVWPDRIRPAGLPSPRVANRLALVFSALKLRRLLTPSFASSSRMKWIRSRLEFALTVLKRTSDWANSRARGEREVTAMGAIVAVYLFHLKFAKANFKCPDQCEGARQSRFPCTKEAGLRDAPLGLRAAAREESGVTTFWTAR